MLGRISVQGNTRAADKQLFNTFFVITITDGSWQNVGLTFSNYFNPVNDLMAYFRIFYY